MRTKKTIVTATLIVVLLSFNNFKVKAQKTTDTTAILNSIFPRGEKV
jgi:hypothetical protein